MGDVSWKPVYNSSKWDTYRKYLQGVFAPGAEGITLSKKTTILRFGSSHINIKHQTLQTLTLYFCSILTEIVLLFFCFNKHPRYGGEIDLRALRPISNWTKFPFLGTVIPYLVQIFACDILLLDKLQSLDIGYQNFDPNWDLSVPVGVKIGRGWASVLNTYSKNANVSR